MASKKFYVTTPIYYANAKPHIGSAYTTIAADVLARWNKLDGKKVFFLTGTDEHGKKIQETAKKAGKKPKEFVDDIAKKYKELFKLLSLDYNNFIRTTDKYHEKEVIRVLTKLHKEKLIYKGHYESYYCVGCEQYLKKSDLVDGKCPLHNSIPELKKEEAYLLKLSKFEKKLLKLIESEKFQILPETRKNEMISFIKSGLQDISISRKKKDVPWAIPLPFDKDHTCYVWVDAFWNYVSGLKEKIKEFWPADVQLMANDILRVHATIWPALLLALGYSLPKTMFIHGYFTVGGKKMSKSLGNVVDPLEMVEKYSADTLRYFLMRNISFGQDGDFSEKALVERHNNELANKLGNLVSRALGLLEKSTQGKYKEGKTTRKLFEQLTLKQIKEHMVKYELDKALNEIFSFVDAVNNYIQDKKPWDLIKQSKKKQFSEVLYNVLDAIRIIAVLLWPFMPLTSERIFKQLGIKKPKLDLKQCKPGLLKSGKIGKREILFKKV